MKYMFLILTFFLFVDGYAQYSTNMKVEGAMHSIRERGYEHGVDLDSIIKIATKNDYPSLLQKIEVVDTIANHPEYVIALTRYKPDHDKEIGWHFHTYVEIKKDMLGDFNELEATVAHELGHVFGLKHAKEGDLIMSVGIDREKGIYYDLMYNSYHTEYRWEQFFNKLKTKYNLNPKEND